MASSAPTGQIRPARGMRDPYRYGDTIHGVFAQWAARQPQAPALVQGETVISYGDLAAAADVLAVTFAERGVSPGCFAVVRMRRSPAFAAALLAILKLGAAYLAAEQAWPGDYLQDILDRADAWLVTDDPGLSLNPARGTLIVGTDALPQAPRIWLPEISVSRDAPCTIFQTSGSTGSPKLAIVPHRATVRAFIDVDYAEFGPGRVIMQASPVCWDGLTMELWSVLLSGGTSLIPAAATPMSGDLLRACSARSGLDTVWLTSSLLSALVNDDITAFAGLRQVMSGGERVSPDHVRRLLAAYPGIRFSSGYGPVETTVFATSYTVSGKGLDQYGEVPLGRPLPATTVLVLDESGAPCPAGKVGEIHVGGDALGLGYLGDPAETRRRFVSGPDGSLLYRTGDLGEWHQTGVLLFRGRVDRQVKIRGQRAEPEEVERFIARALPGVVAAVTPVTDAQRQIIGLAAHCGTGGRETSAADISAVCHEGLPAHLRPRQIYIHPELPRNDNGKIDYEALKRAIAATGARPQAPVDGPHGGSVGDRIVRIASGLLGTAVEASDDLFQLGGDSLFAMRLAARLRREEGLALAVGHIHRERTAERLAKLAVPEPGGVQAAAPKTARRLSPGEEDLCLHEEIFPGDPSLLVLLAYELPDDVNLAAIRAAMVLTCGRHPALSALRVPEGGQVCAHDLTAAQVDRRLHLYQHDEPLAEQDGAVVFPSGWLGPFDLARDLPLRVYVTGKPGDRRQLGLVAHHVAMDGWSEHLFTDDLSGAYDEVTGRRVPPEQPSRPAPSLSPAARPAERSRARDYWRSVLRGIQPLRVPLARPGSSSFTETLLTLTDAQCRALAALPGGHPDLHGGTLAWYADGLSQVFNQMSFAIGSAYAARDLAAEETIGYHVQMVPVRVDCAPGKTLADLASEISGQWLTSLDQRSLSLREIAACAPDARSRGHRPVFQAGFALQQAPPPYLELGGSRHRRLAVRPAAPPFELYLELWPDPGGGVTAHLQWDEACVPSAVARRVAERLRTTAPEL